MIIKSFTDKARRLWLLKGTLECVPCGAQLLNMALSVLHSALLASIKDYRTQDAPLQQLIYWAEGIKKRLSSLLYWKGLSKDVRNYVRAYTICQR